MIDKLIKTEQGKGDEGIKNTLIAMKQLVIDTDQNRIVKQTAQKIIKNISPTDHIGQIKAIFSWVKNNMKYVRDIRGVEELTRPDITIQSIEKGEYLHSADCDDFAMLLSALLRAVGFQTRLEAVAIKSDKQYDHARVSVYNPDTAKWICLEGTKKNSEIGYKLPSKRPPLGVIV